MVLPVGQIGQVHQNVFQQPPVHIAPPEAHHVLGKHLRGSPLGHAGTETDGGKVQSTAAEIHHEQRLFPRDVHPIPERGGDRFIKGAEAPDLQALGDGLQGGTVGFVVTDGRWDREIGDAKALLTRCRKQLPQEQESGLLR